MRRRILNTSVRLTEESRRLLALLTEKLGVNQSALIEMAIRKLAEKEGLK